VVIDDGWGLGQGYIVRGRVVYQVEFYAETQLDDQTTALIIDELRRLDEHSSGG
jgi:hypothetical protein